MEWTGRVSFTRSPGAPTRQLGDTLVPLEVLMHFKGTDTDPNLVLHFRIEDGRPECVDVHIATKPGGRGIRSADLGWFNVDGLAVNAFASFAVPVDKAGAGGHVPFFPPALSERELWRVRGDLTEARKSKRGAVTRADLERVAHVYSEHAAGAPVKAVQELLGYPERTAFRRVRQARDAGLLPPAAPSTKKG